MLKPNHRIYLTAFLLDAAVMVVFATTPFFVYNQIGGDEAMAGVVGALQMAAYALSCLVSSRFVGQTKNGLRWAVVGACLFIFFSCLMPLYPNVLFCGVVTSLSFVALGFVWPALQSWIGAEPNSARRAQHMAYFVISAGCGFALSPLLGGPLYDLDYRMPFAAVAVLGVAIVALIQTLPREDEHFSAADLEEDETPRDSGGFNATNLLAAWCALFVANILVGATRSVYPKRVMNLLDTESLQFFFGRGPNAILSQGPATTFSWLVSTLWIATALCFYIMGKKHHWHHRIGMLLWLQVLAGGATWLLGYTEQLSLMVLCFAAIGVNFGITFFIALSYSLADPLHKHRRAAMTEGILGAGCLAGSIGFGYVAGSLDVTTPFLYTPALIAIGLGIQLWLLRKGRQA